MEVRWLSMLITEFIPMDHTRSGFLHCLRRQSRAVIVPHSPLSPQVGTPTPISPYQKPRSPQAISPISQLRVHWQYTQNPYLPDAGLPLEIGSRKNWGEIRPCPNKNTHY